MKLPRCIATNALLLLALLFTGALAHAAQVAGTITHLSGPLLAKKADGSVKILSQQSTVEQGDVLFTEKDTYARIKFADNSEITLKPNSQLKIDSFVFEEGAPDKDSATFSLVKGGLRAITGLLGKRNKERVGVNTPAATIGIRGTTFLVEYVPPSQSAVAAYGFASVAAAGASSWTSDRARLTDMPFSEAPLAILPRREETPVVLAQLMPSAPPVRAPGLYVQVVDGMINLSNKGGTQSFSAGQFGFVPSFQQPPILLPVNPGIQFTPPPAFSASVGAQGRQDAGAASSAVDCEVR
ncbi:iron dicitrate transport regulator FecR [Noviherbaspirillum cavernae]|uniref:Iron dicitrate transport regulator FecR n=1 Tax=Noviherbaspirillum cavernae TaxID=2320862 RepID=A0A418X2W4_9BURK|nr:FecR family protein [Noviherbaspirillum cavernae]RJG06807.1 iron dicitrate transport regulator FecR [Noviherbaspirillum cavernae]